MSNITSILREIEKDIKTDDQRSYSRSEQTRPKGYLAASSEIVYFWTHEVRYTYILKQIENISRNKKLNILDIGCYPYHIGEALELLGHTVRGIASHHEPVAHKNVAVLNIETEKFPYKNGVFDLVLFNEIIEHLPQSPVIAIKEIYRVTKRGGFIMITTPNISRSINRAKLLFGKTIMYSPDVYFEQQGKGNNIYHRHNREFTLGELYTLLEKTSWSVVKKDYFISYAPFRKRLIPDPLLLLTGKWINYLLMIAIPPVRDTLFVLGQKT